MAIDLAPAHRYLDFMSPMSSHRADEIARFVASRANGTVVDIGCGWAEFLLRVLSANDKLRGLGIDLKPAGFPHAMRLASERGVADRLELIAGDAKDHLPDSSAAAICIGASQIWGAGVEAGLPMDYVAALGALRRMVKVGAPVVYGEGIWRTAPTQAATAPLSGRSDEFVFLPELIDLACRCGFALVQVHEANQDEWDHFESGYTAAYADWLAETTDPEHPTRAEVLARAERQRKAYFHGYRGVLGMAYLCMLAV